ncbi:hypothetical protein ACLOJK_012440 [Asimina triloba]
MKVDDTKSQIIFLVSSAFFCLSYEILVIFFLRQPVLQEIEDMRQKLRKSGRYSSFENPTFDLWISGNDDAILHLISQLLFHSKSFIFLDPRSPDPRPPLHFRPLHSSIGKRSQLSHSTPPFSLSRDLGFLKVCCSGFSVLFHRIPDSARGILSKPLYCSNSIVSCPFAMLKNHDKEFQILGPLELLPLAIVFFFHRFVVMSLEEPGVSDTNRYSKRDNVVYKILRGFLKQGNNGFINIATNAVRRATGHRSSNGYQAVFGDDINLQIAADEKMHERRAGPLVSGVAYCISSCSMILLNKVVLSGHYDAGDLWSCVNRKAHLEAVSDMDSLLQFPGNYSSEFIGLTSAKFQKRAMFLIISLMRCLSKMIEAISSFYL